MTALAPANVSVGALGSRRFMWVSNPAANRAGAFARVWAGRPRMDERAAQFFVSVGRMCADAAIARLSVTVRVADGGEIIGVPHAPPPTEGVKELDETGLPDEIAVDGVVVALSDIVEASLIHPGVERNAAGTP